MWVLLECPVPLRLKKGVAVRISKLAADCRDTVAAVSRANRFEVAEG